MPILYLSGAWVLGLAVGCLVSLPWWAICFSAVPALLAVFSKRRRMLVLASLCVLAMLNGVVHSGSVRGQRDSTWLQKYNGQGTIELVGTVDRPPEMAGTAQSIVLSVTGAADSHSMPPCSLQIWTSQFPEYSYGDELRIVGEPVSPAESGNTGYSAYLERQGIHSSVSYPQIRLIGRGRASQVLGAIYRIREVLAAQVAAVLPEPQSSLAQGVALGLRSHVPDSLNEAFRRTGTAHLLAISGLNLTIIIGMVLSIGKWLFGKKRSLYIWIALLFLWAYTMLTGMNPPVVRGAIMGSIFLAGEYLGRQRSSTVALVLAAAVMAGLEPGLLGDVSFQLSFLSMAGLIFLAGPLQSTVNQWLSVALERRDALAGAARVISDSLIVSLGATLATLPLLAYYFGSISLVGLPATFLALPSQTPIIAGTMLASLSHLVIPIAGQVIAWFDWLFLTYFIMVVNAFNALPFASFKIAIEPWQIWAYYVVATVALAYLGTGGVDGRLLRRCREVSFAAASAIGSFFLWLPKKPVMPLLAAGTMLIWAADATAPDAQLHVSFLDVGQGDAILVQTPDHRNILIDGGPSRDAIVNELGKKMPFWDRSIDLLVLTQPQADHLTGLLEVLDRYGVKRAVEPGVAADSLGYDEWARALAKRHVYRTVVRSGQNISLGRDIYMEVLSPDCPTADANESGLVLRLSWNKVAFLLTADIGEETELGLVSNKGNLASDVLKVAHHGSRTSSCPEFLKAVRPEVCVISVGKENRFGHPDPVVTSRLAGLVGEEQVYLTSEYGTIEFVTDGERLWVLKGDK